ncbi:DUF4440 domain-containing protein [Ulvibacter sp. MAR_2010_11]|uniref:DUF4440 domain-containing protein n=1 Tax=Ulvibacter sp. MAR_2010_11 TaxID=1250229 RepID=UPI0012FE79F6|nr:DUF4440 domain-containing protein [Ulvibacter sp. MAR_2010_11]
MESIKSELQEATNKEQLAFKNGDCQEVVDSMESDITFIANGNKVPSKAVIQKFCNSIPRPFKKATIDNLDIYPLTNETGYTIRTLEYQKDSQIKILEYVTKIWRKSDGKWKITHFQSTLKEISISDK